MEVTGSDFPYRAPTRAQCPYAVWEDGRMHPCRLEAKHRGPCDIIYNADQDRSRPRGKRVLVETDHNPDEVRSFFEIPQAIVDRVWQPDDSRTFAQALADLLEGVPHEG